MITEVKKIVFGEKNYPRLLKKIDNPPKILYVQGNICANENCFAIVGTRRCTPYGKQIAREIAIDLAEAGLTIVSGFASGIDTEVHKAVIEKRKRTIAVVGTGLDEKVIYPKSNLKLVKRILENGGALISEFPPKTHGTKYTFVQRNRIISGLSLGVLVVEARMKSGALITANYAISQKRKLFAIPGSIYSQTSKGCNHLIKNGAKLAEGANDILKELNLPVLSNKKEIAGENLEENLILGALKEGALDVEKIIEKTKLPTAKVLTTLSILEIKGKIKNLEANIYVLSNS